MSNNKLRVELDSKIDKNGHKYYVGRMKSPISLNCENGIVFMIFTSEEGEEELQILSPKKNKLPKYQVVPVEKIAKKNRGTEDVSHFDAVVEDDQEWETADTEEI